MMTPSQLVQYYSNLLIMQYQGQPKATGMIRALAAMALLPQVSTQLVSFSGAPASGSFTLTYGSLTTGSIAWNASALAIQGALQALSGLGSVTVSGSISESGFTVTFTGVTPPALMLILSSNTLLDGSSNPIIPTLTETDVTLPLAVQSAYDINTAVGVQLDVLGKYAGVSRTGNTFSGSVTLSDSDYRTIIKMAIIQNNSGSSLADIQSFIHAYFPTSLRAFDYANMQMDYYFNAELGTSQLAEYFVRQGLLPKPMGVQLGAVIYSPDINSFFGLRTYTLDAQNVTPLNTYSSYQDYGPWLSYANAIY